MSGGGIASGGGTASGRSVASSRDTAGTRGDRLDRVPWGAVALFVVVAYALAWLIILPLWLSPELLASPLSGVFPAAMMFAPALAAVAALFLARTPRTRRLEFLGMWPLRPAKRTIWFAVGTVFAPTVIVLASVFLSAAFGWVRLDLVNFSGFAATLAASTPPEALDLLPPVQLLALVQLLAIPINSLFVSVLAFGEEIGWRGWLLPALRPLGTWPALILSGAIWGLWHTPVTLLGHNYGLTDWRGVALMTVSCVLLGIVLGWTRLRTGSVWPAVFGHGAWNASGSVLLVLASAGDTLNTVLGGPMGVGGWIVLAVIIVVLAATGQFRKQPPLGALRPARPL
ncbi:MAG: lysostaphin resistance A-like protein [Leucobacter sp.]